MSRSRRILTWQSIGAVVVCLAVSAVTIQQADSIQEAEAINQQVHTLVEEGRISEAIPLAQQALGILEKVQGPEHPGTAAAINSLASLYRKTGAYAQAEPLYQRALAIREEVLGPEHSDTAASLNNLGLLYRDARAFAKAEPLLQRALAVDEKVFGPEHPANATVLDNLGELYVETGTYGKAEPLLQRALAIREKTLGPEHPETATTINNLAFLYQNSDNYAKAEPLHQRALAIREKVVGPEHPVTVQSLNNLGMVYLATGAYAKAEPLLTRALSICEKTSGPDHPNTALALNSLAVLHQVTGAYTKAEPLHQRALAIYENVLGPEHPAAATSLDNLAGVYAATGAYSQAEPLFRRALAMREKALGSEHPDIARALSKLAELYLYTQAYTMVEPLLHRALAIREKVLGSEHSDTAGSLISLAQYHWAMGHAEAALSLLEQGQRIVAKHHQRFLASGSESRKQAYLRQLRRNTFFQISFSLAHSGQRATTLGFTSVLQTKGRVLDAMADSRGRLRASMKPEHGTLLDELTVVAQQLSTLIHQDSENLQPEVSRRRREELFSRQERLETELSKESAVFHEQVAPASLKAVQTAIPKGAILVEWYCYHPFDPKAKDQQSQWGKSRYVAYVVKHDGQPVVVDVGDAESIDQLVHDFRAGLSDRTNTYVKDVSKELYEKLLKPLQPHLDDAQHLLLSPDGALNLVPFAALMDESGAYLGAKKSISYLTSGRDLLKFGTTSVSKSDMVVVANPDYGPSAKQLAQVDSSVQSTRSLDLDREGMTFTPLPGTAEEAKTLKALIKISDDHVLTQGRATEERFKQLHGPKILHVATHGFFLKDNELPTARLSQVSFTQDTPLVPVGENPLLRSGLALAGANLRRSGENDDGILTAAEVAQMDLRGTQLVVLSACETGVGDVQNGEGVYGLRRALVLAGAETQVTSLWKVADEATKDLMMDYYKRLLEGEGRSEALRNAQLAMMKSKDRSHPYYWAAFVPIGNWTPLVVRK